VHRLTARTICASNRLPLWLRGFRNGMAVLAVAGLAAFVLFATVNVRASQQSTGPVLVQADGPLPGARVGFGVRPHTALGQIPSAAPLNASSISSQTTGTGPSCELIVRLKNVTVQSTALARLQWQRTVRRHGLRIRRNGYREAFQVVSVPPGTSPAALCQALRRDPSVAYAEPNGLLCASQSPAPPQEEPVNDPLFRYQWNLSDAGFGIRAPSAWKRAPGKGAGIIVAVLDTGIAYENRGVYRQVPDFAGTSFVPGYDFVNDDPYANDDNRHGTHVAGIIAQATGNALGCAGIAPGATLMPVKVLNAQAFGTDDWVANGIRFAADHGAKIINMSLGGPFYSQTMQEAIEYATSRGVLIAAAAGNQGAPAVDYPARAPQCLSVGATRYDGSRCYYSNYGPELSLVAPGGDNLVDQNGDSYPDGILQLSLEDNDPTRFRYRFESGTSFSVAHVSGVAALVWSLHPDWSAATVRAALLETARDLGAPGPDPLYGGGLLDAAAAAAWSPPPPAPGPSTDEQDKDSAGKDAGSEQPQDGPVPADEEVDDEQPAGGPPPLPPGPTHDVRLDAVQAPDELPLGAATALGVIVANGGSMTERIAVSLIDSTTKAALGPREVVLEPGATTVVAFDWRAVAPLGDHHWIARAVLIGAADEQPGDNERAVDLTVAKGVLELLVSPGKPSYRRGERVLVSVAGRCPDIAPGAANPVAGAVLNVLVLSSPGTPVYLGKAKADKNGRAVFTLPPGLWRSGLGPYRVLVSTSLEKYQSATAATTFLFTP
jgi:serine protease